MPATVTVEDRVARAAQQALDDHKYVSAVEVLMGLGWLTPFDYREWRNGRASPLEAVVHAGLGKISLAMASFHRWALDRGLKPSETAYRKWGKGASVDLQFSVSGNPEIERAYRTHYVSPVLTERRRETLKVKLETAPEQVVYWIIRDSECSRCKDELFKGQFIVLEERQPLCLKCARLSHLEFLERGSAALTRRASKYSRQRCVVVRFSRSRGRYERQGILVEAEALKRAERELGMAGEED